MSDTARYAMYYGLTGCFDKLYQCSKHNQNFEHLMEIVSSREVILLAHRAIKRNQGSETPGVDSVTVRDIETLPVETLVAMVQNKFKWYVPKPVKRVEIPKESDPTKTRPLGIPCYIDRLCQECIKLVLEPIAEAKFHPNSFGFRPDRSCENAIAKCESIIMVEGMHYVVDIDIRSYFDCVGHGCLMRQLWKLGIHDRKLLAIIYAMLKAPICYPDGTKEIPSRGVPQGGVLSTLLANICLNDLDWYISNQWDTCPLEREYRDKKCRENHLRKMGKQKVHIIRYADDVKLFCESREVATNLLRDTTEWLKDKLGLDTSPEKSGVTNLRRNYSPFLGIELKVKDKVKNLPPNYKGRKLRWVYTSRIKQKALLKIQTKLEGKMMSLVSVGEADVPVAVSEYNSVVDGIANYYSMATQAARELSDIQRNLSKRMWNRIEGITQVAPEHPKINSANDRRAMRLKRPYFLKGCVIHPLGMFGYNRAKWVVDGICNYTAHGRSLMKIQTGVPPPLLAMVGRHPPPKMPVELADNRVSLYSSQKGKCAILGETILPGGFDTILKIPTRTRDKYRFGNVALVSPVASMVITEKDRCNLAKLIQGLALNDDQKEKIQKYRVWRKLPPM